MHLRDPNKKLEQAWEGVAEIGTKKKSNRITSELPYISFINNSVYSQFINTIPVHFNIFILGQ